MERFEITHMDGSTTTITPTAGDKMRGRRECGIGARELTIGDVYLFAAFSAARRLEVLGADKCESVEEWADTIHNVTVAIDEEPEASSAEGEDGATPAS